MISRRQERRMIEVDMMNNFNDLMNIYDRLRQNPRQVLSARFNIPQDVDLNDPNAIIQHLLNSGQATQSQVNQIMSMRSNPILGRFFKH